MDYKVCILAAGVGNRMGELSEYSNKAILPVNFKAVISYIIEKFPKKIEFVVAVGHEKETVKNYLAIAHSDRKITYVEVDKYIGPGTGPGYSLLCCKKHLQCPFVFSTADTIVLEEIPSPNQNWFGIAPVKETERYCTVKMKNNLIYELDDKVKTDNRFAFIGLAGVFDYAVFFQALEKNRSLVNNETQVSDGFRKLIEKKLIPIGFTWRDTGTLENYKETNKNFSGEEKRFDFSKGSEFLYFVNGRVIKFFADKKIAENRYLRAQKYLKGLCPKIDKKLDNFYSYKKIDGLVLYNSLSPEMIRSFLEWAKKNLWKRIVLVGKKKTSFALACQRFYYGKTLERLERFYNKTGIKDGVDIINGVATPKLGALLKKIDWKTITAGLPSNFHGDLQFDNILVPSKHNGGSQEFVLLDWRQDFGGLVAVGDLYYDLAKLYGGLILPYQLIKEGMFSFSVSGKSVVFDFFLKNDLIEAKEIYEEFLLKNGFDLRKIKIMVALIFLNMSPLHHDPFDKLLYYLGKNSLRKLLNDV